VNKPPLIQYVMDPHDDTYRVGCLVALILPDGKIGVGWSQCNPLDNFSKKVARQIATQRALGGATDKPTPYRFYRPDGSYEKRDVLGAQLDAFRFRALNYFTPELAVDKPIADLQITLTVAPSPAVVK
jgi:hypothetical protein